jgi:hypothetical protein
MKHGIYKGYNAGCNDGLNVWGVSCDVPAVDSYRGDSSEQNRFHLLDLSYNLNNKDGAVLYGSSYETEVVPDLWPRSGSGRTWPFYAAKVPGTYPGKCCGECPSSSSEIGAGNSTWQYSLGVCAAHVIDTAPEPDDHLIPIKARCHGSRAVYVDGQQAHIVYSTSNLVDGSYGQPNPQLTHGTIDVINIAQTNIEDQTGARHLLGTLDNKFSDTVLDPGDGAGMEYNFLKAYRDTRTGTYLRNVTKAAFSEGVFGMGQPPTNAICYGLEYAVMSTYAPGKEQWSVGRVKYSDYSVVMTAFYDAGAGFIVEHLGYPESVEGAYDKDFTRDWWVVLPSCRTYIDSGAAGVDECWVLAIHRDSLYYTEDSETFVRTYPNTKQMKIAKWQSSETNAGYSTGSLHADEATAGTLIFTSNSAAALAAMSHVDEEYPDESWNRIEVRCYNRVYDPTTGHSRDLVLFTTQDSPSFEYVEDIKATFEGGDLNTGLSAAEIAFQTGGLVDTSGWKSSAYSPLTGTYSAKADPVAAYTDQTVFLTLSFQKATAGYVTFKYRHINRLWVTLQPLEGTYQLSSQPDWRNYLDIRLDGSLLSGNTKINQSAALDASNSVLTVDNGEGFVICPSSRIDNQTSPEDCTGDVAKFEQVRDVKIWVTPGAHTISFEQRRASMPTVAYAPSIDSQIDELFLGTLMIGEDTTGKKRWLYNGEKIQKAEWWAWPHRDDERETNMASRVSTAPDYITLDKAGRILYGNPHYVCRLIADEENEGLFKLDTSFGKDKGTGSGGDEGGFIRFTGSYSSRTSGEFQLPTCENPDPDYETQDVVADPFWGAFQILPFGAYGDFQLRGVNSSIRDATEPPFGEFDYERNAAVDAKDGYEIFNDNKLAVRPNSGAWTHRLSAWTVTDDGKVLRPHCEVIWRPTRQSPGFPVHEDDMTNANGYPNWFANGNPPSPSVVEAYWSSYRPHDPLKIAVGSSLPRWTTANYIIPATHSDSFSHAPQNVWVHQINDDPTDPLDIADFDPDVWGAWRSAEWQLVQARYVPTGLYVRWFWYGPGALGTSPSPEDTCDEDEENDPVRGLHFAMQGGLSIGGITRINTDFDVVDVDSNCCD